MKNDERNNALKQFEIRPTRSPKYQLIRSIEDAKLNPGEFQSEHYNRPIGTHHDAHRESDRRHGSVMVNQKSEESNSIRGMRTPKRSLQLPNVDGEALLAAG